MSPCFSLSSTCQRWKRASRMSLIKAAKTSVIMGGCISSHGDLHICEGAIDVEASIGILERLFLPRRWRLSLETPRLFQETDVIPYSAPVTTAWLHRHIMHVLHCFACSPDLCSVGNVRHIGKKNIRQQQPQTVEQFNSRLQQEYKRGLSAKIQQLI